jgi:DNA-binding NarL/FixJ family response regulator
MPTQLLLADGQTMVRQSLRTSLEQQGFRVIAEASDGLEAVRLAGEKRPDAAILGLGMSGLNGVEAGREIRRASKDVKTILLTARADDAHVLDALSGGFAAYVLKTQAIDDLIRAIREVLQGRIYLSPRVSRAVVEAYRNRTRLPVDPLSAREREVLQLVAEGRTTKEIGALLGVSARTAESHRTHIMSKLNIHATALLVRYAIRRGMVRA